MKFYKYIKIPSGEAMVKILSHNLLLLAYDEIQNLELDSEEELKLLRDFNEKYAEAIRVIGDLCTY